LDLCGSDTRGGGNISYCRTGSAIKIIITIWAIIEDYDGRSRVLRHKTTAAKILKVPLSILNLYKSPFCLLQLLPNNSRAVDPCRPFHDSFQIVIWRHRHRGLLNWSFSIRLLPLVLITYYLSLYLLY